MVREEEAAAAPAGSAAEQPAAEVSDIAREEELPEENEANPRDIPLD